MKTDIPAAIGSKSKSHKDTAPKQLTAEPQPLLLNIKDLAKLLARSVPSLRRDDAAGRLPSALRLCAAKRWRRADIDLWVELGCPGRTEFQARRAQ